MSTKSRIDMSIIVNKVKLDKRDEKILSILSEDSRITLSTVAKKLKINRDTLKYKIQRLEQKDIILKYFAEIDLSVFGYDTCHIFILLDEIEVDKHEEFLSFLHNHPNTKNIIEYNDKWDFEWIIIAKNIKDLDKIISEVTSKFSSLILERESLYVIEYFPTTRLQYEFYKEAVSLRDLRDKGKLKIDDKDFKILKCLSEDARQNAVAIAGRVPLSSDSTINRIKQLYQKGIITRYTTLLNKRKLGLMMHAVAIKTTHFDKKHQKRLRTWVREHPHITRCVKTMGNFDLYMYVFSTKPGEFHRTIKSFRKEFSDVIKYYETWIVFKEHTFINFPKVVSFEDFTS